MTSSIPAITSIISTTSANPQRDYQITWLATFLFFVAYYALIAPLPRYLTGLGLPDWLVRRPSPERVQCFLGNF
ncbi:MAG: hypothetical protein KF832_15935 [Caldilineaceae bacterium]|nr:hypothetical protein [Caldilineaceae bacterium]